MPSCLFAATLSCIQPRRQANRLVVLSPAPLPARPFGVHGPARVHAICPCAQRPGACQTTSLAISRPCRS
eukprot:370529-Alexandrium_andersonii.AAC.1